MGQLIYGSSDVYEFDDRVLAHVQVVVGRKLRRHETFYLSWVKPVESGSGRVTVWISPHIPLQFHFVGGRPPRLNDTWLREMLATSHGDRGLVVTREPDSLPLTEPPRPPALG